ncbi:hypothetical protein Tco_0221481 [Tanacetum coccineum]
MVVQHQEEIGEGSAKPTDPHHTPTIIQPSTSQPQKKQKPRRPKRKDTEIPQSSGPTYNVADEAINMEMDDSLERAATTATSLDAEQDSGNINKTQSKAIPNEPSSLGTSSGGSPRRQETISDTIAQTRSENVSKHSNDPLVARGNTLRSGEDRLKLEELIEFCTKLQQRVLDLENTKTAQAQRITSLKLRVKKLEKKGGSRNHKLKRLYKVGRSTRMVSSDDASLGDQEDPSKQGRKINDIDKDAEITLIDETQGSTADLVTTASEVVTTASLTETITADDLNLAQTLIEIRSEKSKVKGVVIGEQSESTTRTRHQQLPSKDKGKGIMEEPEKPTKKKDQIRHDEEVAQRLQAQMQAELEEEDRLVRQREEEANIISWDNVQAMIDADYQMAQQMQVEEQEKLSIKEKSKLFVQLLEARKKHFAAIRAKKRGTNHQLKLKREIQYMDTELVEGSEVRAEGSETRAEGSSKRAGEELEQESSKKQKLEEDKESEELKQCLEIVPDDGDDVTIDATPLSTKSPTIVDYKIHKEGKKSFFQIIRVDGKHQMYLTFGKMLKDFDREELEVLWSIVKARFKKTEPVSYMDNFLLLNLKTMFKHHIEDNVWKNQQGLVKVLNWKLYDSCGVHCVTMQSMLFYLLVEKMYPLTKHTLHQMFNDVKLQVDYECEMEFELL